MEKTLEIENIKRENEVYLAAFQTYLKSSEISEKLSKRYIYYTNYYINEYLAQELQKRMVEGIQELHDFYMKYFYGNYNDFGVFASEEIMEKILESLMYFYHCMNDLGYITDELYVLFRNTVKENKSQWVSNFREWQEIDNTITHSVIESIEE